MKVVNQEAQIRVENKGVTVIHMGSTFPPNKVLIPDDSVAVFISRLPEGKYHDAIINGDRDNKKNTITIECLSF